MIWNLELSTLKIDQSAFIHNFVEEKGMQHCNSVTILMKTGNFIELPEDNYKEIDLKVY